MTTDLGTVYTAQQVAEYLGLDVNTIRRYYKELGGIRVGTTYRFFERTLTDAILRQTEKEICGTDQKEREVYPEIFPYPEGSVQMGTRSSKTRESITTIDKYHLLA